MKRLIPLVLGLCIAVPSPAQDLGLRFGGGPAYVQPGGVDNETNSELGAQVSGGLRLQAGRLTAIAELSGESAGGGGAMLSAALARNSGEPDPYVSYIGAGAATDEVYGAPVSPHLLVGSRFEHGQLGLAVEGRVGPRQFSITARVEGILSDL